ncbi:MAG: hypothetical protein O0V67_00290 [Methanocorpusculum sp.]|nr:hypothetical protein [Methanocorpusculum sp.]
MAKINTALIEGYDKMTPEQKLAALEGYEMADPDFSGYVKKDIFDKTASELASAKKQIKEKMTADELREKEEAEKREKLQNDYDSLLKRVTVSDNKAKLLALGYEDSLAGETAEAMANGELDKVFANQKKHMDSLEKKIRADVLKDTPKPGKDTVPGAVDYQKKIEEAQQNGDMSAAAYYTRLAAQAETQNK